MNTGKIISFIAAFVIGVAVFTLANEIILKLPNKENIFKGKPKSFEKYSPRCLIIQILGGIFGVLMVWQFGVSLEAVTVFLFFTLLTIITFVDADTMEIPFVLNVCILALGVISIFTRGGFVLTGNDLSLVSRLIGMLCISLPLFLIVLVIPDGFGGGDIKLMFAAGFFLGWKATVIAFFIGLIIGGCQGVILLVRRKKGKEEHFAFGPALSVGLMIATFAGSGLMDRYLNMIRAEIYA